ncbi:ubiquinol-cytochrome c reductase complex assembly factor 1 isoform X2 [Ambystoma mexicanum]|uniref:ubiquinol-cytochrome c reductase complex assembly factor 1 isoform X2 n=1 Tax=Ambystoma mexicanum TaxID=8296 RepID=UPI0037E75929
MFLRCTWRIGFYWRQEVRPSVLFHQIGLCTGSVQKSCVKAAWSRTLYGSNQKKLCCGFTQTNLSVTQPCRSLHRSNKVCTTKGNLQPSEEEVGAFTKIIEAMGFTGPLKYNKWKIKIAALRMYTCCVERIDYDEFFDKCSLPDTLNSWFLVTQLHVWMCLVRMKQEGRAGKYMCRYIVHSMWEDVEQRGKVMGIDSVSLKSSMRTMTEHFYAAIFGYDEAQNMTAMPRTHPHSKPHPRRGPGMRPTGLPPRRANPKAHCAPPLKTPQVARAPVLPRAVEAEAPIPVDQPQETDEAPHSAESSLAGEVAATAPQAEEEAQEEVWVPMEDNSSELPRTPSPLPSPKFTSLESDHGTTPEQSGGGVNSRGY